MTAQDVFATTLRTRIAPALRELGFTGSGQVFELRDDTYWVLLGFQRSRYSTADEVEFTVNLTVVSKQDWADFRARTPDVGVRPRANAYGTGWVRRIADMMPADADPWWVIGSDDDPDTLAATADNLLDAVTKFVIPDMRARTSRAKGR